MSGLTTPATTGLIPLDGNIGFLVGVPNSDYSEEFKSSIDSISD